jgi:hypothetical protein
MSSKNRKLDLPGLVLSGNFDKKEADELKVLLEEPDTDERNKKIHIIFNVAHSRHLTESHLANIDTTTDRASCWNANSKHHSATGLLKAYGMINVEPCSRIQANSRMTIDMWSG